MRALTLLLLLPLCASARAQVPLSASVGVEFSPGYDSNLYLDSSALPSDQQEVGGMLLRLTPSVEGALGQRASHHLFIAYEADLKQFLLSTRGEETLLLNRGTLGYMTPPLAGFRISAVMSFSHLYLRELPGGGWANLEGGVGVQRSLGDSVRASFGYRAGYVAYSSDSSVAEETTHNVSAGVTWRVVRGLNLDLYYNLLIGDASPDELDSLHHEPGVALRWLIPGTPLRLGAGYSPGVLQCTSVVSSTNPQGKPLPDKYVDRTDLLHQVDAEVGLSVGTWLGIFLRYQVLLGSSNTEPNYSRHQVLVGLSFSWGCERRRPPSAAPVKAVKHG